MGRPDDPVAMADCRAAAELKQAAEAARAALLAGANNAEDVVRIENAVLRAEKRLKLGKRAEKHSDELSEYLP